MSAERCPSCAAAVRADDPWCTLCYASLRPELQAVAESLQTVPSSAPPAPAYSSPGPPEITVDAADPLGVASPPAPRSPLEGARWSCVSCGTLSSYEDLACPTCGRALLADDGPTVPSVIKSTTPGSKVAFMFGGAVAVMAVIMIVLYVVGSML